MLRTLCQKRFYTTYQISRTSNKGLPVYSEYKNGRTNLSTIVRRIKGDPNALVNDLKADFPEVVAHVNSNTQNVVIKGHCVNDIKYWLVLKGF
ncbi:ribosomal protein L49/IMG2 [Sporodiniella umbellata]|nr:ribosomal protein L49/IMG2 [Sporodiniella umbellata]